MSRARSNWVQQTRRPGAVMADVVELRLEVWDVVLERFQAIPRLAPIRIPLHFDSHVPPAQQEQAEVILAQRRDVARQTALAEARRQAVLIVDDREHGCDRVVIFDRGQPLEFCVR